MRSARGYFKKMEMFWGVDCKHGTGWEADDREKGDALPDLCGRGVFVSSSNKLKDIAAASGLLPRNPFFDTSSRQCSPKSKGARS